MRRRARSAASPPSGARRPREASGLSPPNAVVDPDPDPAADEEPPAASRRPHLELPRRGEHRALDLRSVRIFVEPPAILDTINGPRATGPTPPTAPAGGRRNTPARN